MAVKLCFSDMNMKIKLSTIGGESETLLFFLFSYSN